VFGILETGAGKSVSFFGAPFLLPKKCFIVVSPLVALTQDLAPRLLQFGIRGGVFGQHEIDSSTAQLVIVSAHKAGTDKFYDWAMTYPIRSRLHRIFIDEAQKILTDKDYRQCFKLFWRLIEIGVPVTCLSGSLMPRSMPLILNALEIRDPSLVDEIRRYTGRPNLKYVIEKLDDDKNMLPSIKQLQEQESKKFKGGDRGIIFVSTHVRAAEVQKMLGCPMYTGRLSSEEREDAVKRWKEGIEPSDRWMVATEAFGQGVDYAHVRCTIHDNPKALLNYVQETGRAGRDRLPAICHTVWSMLPYIKEKDGPDHEGRADMARLLPTTGCIRLSFAPLDRVAHSCIALDAQLCSNCEKSSKVCIFSFHVILLNARCFRYPTTSPCKANQDSTGRWFHRTQQTHHPPLCQCLSKQTRPKFIPNVKLVTRSLSNLISFSVTHTSTAVLTVLSTTRSTRLV
jgi:superfamily II DNA helicase RecQ